MTSGRKRVLFLVPAFTGGVGGAERVAVTLLRHIDHNRFECHLGLAQPGAAYLQSIPENVVVHQLRVSRMRYALPAIVRLIRSLRPQTVLATVSYLNVMLLMAKPFLPRNIRLVVREATTPSAFVANDTAHPRLWTWFYRHLYPRADKVVCLSDAMFEDMAVHFDIPREKLVRIYNPVDVKMIRHASRSKPNPYQTSGPNLVVAGRLRKEKGVDLLLDALPAVAQRFPNVRLAVLGEGPQEAELRAQTTRLGINKNVDFWGFQENPWTYLGHADLFILPSRFEGMPNALLEALALGTPAIASASVGALDEIARTNEQLLLVPPENTAALAEGIISVLNKPSSGRASLELAVSRQEKFDVQEVTNQYSCLF
jgi:glycosyltransferase involved in cell wall biosynthesis